MTDPARTGPPATDLELASDLVVHAARLVRAVRRTLDLPAGVRLLSILDEHGPLGVSRLAVLDRCSQPTMSAAVAAAADRGWVDKQPNPDDARSSVVTLTRAGRAELARIRRTNGETVAARLAALPQHSRQDVATAVAVLRDLLDISLEPHDLSEGAAR
ncbi:MarR family transcriptional regulator [Nocardioides sp. SOB77]|uniref:MarR family transcriptional regulator n=1 Tax=Nocardioides oceani TaxID=3058369 RepID=A0ABT8FD89_9ACTN|nr:MarR family transcriptional regulator [Nocardioides oceani]MDN4172525.1 MarR family transcriptional regulator [Nocardioides oceani]